MDISRISEAAIAQSATTALQIGIIDILLEWGFSPSAIVGHSSGEIAAGYAAGALTMREAIIAAYLRGVAVMRIAKSGAMAAVGLSRQETSRFLMNGVKVACENSPRSVTISGDCEGIDHAIARIKAENPDVLCKRLRVHTAYHSGKSILKCISVLPQKPSTEILST